MTTTQRAFVVLTAVALTASAIPLRAQQSTTAQGVLMRVEPASKTFTIETPQGIEMQFKYTDQTTVSGVQGGLAGLATMAGTDVTIWYVQQDKVSVAAQIEIRPKK